MELKNKKTKMKKRNAMSTKCQSCGKFRVIHSFRLTEDEYLYDIRCKKCHLIDEENKENKD